MKEAYLLLSSFPQCHCESACFNHDVCWLVEQREHVEVETPRHQQKIVRNMVKTKWQIEQDASQIWQFDCVTLICGELGGFRRGKHSAALFHNPNEDVRMTVRDYDFVCWQTMMDSNSGKLVKSRYVANNMGTLRFEDSDGKGLLLLNRVF